MIDSLTRQNAGDFRQRYNGTFGYYTINEGPRKGNKILVRLTDVNDSQVTFIDSRGSEYYVYADSGIPFEFLPLEKRVANTAKGNVIYGCRVPARQWSRGVSERNTSIINLQSRMAVSVNFVNLEALYSAEDNYPTAFSEFVKGSRKGAALDKKFSIIKNPDETINVKLFNSDIGVFSDGVAKIIPLFKQEFSDMVSRSKFDIKVEVLNNG